MLVLLTVLDNFQIQLCQKLTPECEYCNEKLFILSAVFLFGAAAANAGTPKLLGEYNDWSAFYYQDGKNVVCYMASSPQKDEGKYTQRGDIYVVITHRPAEKALTSSISLPAIPTSATPKWW